MPASADPAASARLFTFDDPAVTRDAPHLRLGCAQLAHRLHLDGLNDDGATVLETARQLAEFVEGTE
ncbi:hypothetical protein SEA_TINIBUG_1 [Mycobacterium Phage TiniBug]|nr:hypothetical protein SEA_TINIBUG_1 [Mycobacterium Phage TiniBug]